MKTLLPAFTCALCVFLAGCGKGDSLTLVPVTGVVRFDQKPEPGCAVTFLPVGDTGGAAITGLTDAAGKYRLSTLHLGEGAPVGEYRVVISKYVKLDGSDFPPGTVVAPMDMEAREKLPILYSDAEQSTLTATVKENGPPIDFDLKSMP